MIFFKKNWRVQEPFLLKVQNGVERPRLLTLWESRESSGEASLAALFNGQDITGAKSACPDLDEVAFLLCRGGWPYACELNGRTALRRAFAYLDASGLECDAVAHMRNGKYGLVEIKLGGKELIEKGVATLKKLTARIDTVKMSSPSFLMVLTATGDFAYRRDDGVVVCPLGCLKP